MKLFSSIVFACVLAAGCRNPSEPATDLIRVKVENEALDVKNISSDPVYYFVADQDRLALLDWAACTQPSQTWCTFVAPGATKRINFSEFIDGTSTGNKKAVVYHWRLIPKSATTYDYDSIRSLVVDLR